MSTALMPLDPAVSPEQALRILPIRANLLPTEITSGRNARRTRFLLIGAVALVAVVMGGWYLLADQQRDLASSDLASVTKQADGIRNRMRTDQEYANVTKVITERDEIKVSLNGVLVKDLPWYTLLDALDSTADKKGGTITDLSAAVPQEAATNARAGTIGTLQITGTAKDKKTVADVVDALSGVTGVKNTYLTATNAQATDWTFTVTADISSDYVCGRFSTKTCGSK